MFPLSNLIKIDANILFVMMRIMSEFIRETCFHEAFCTLNGEKEQNKETKDENHLKQAYKFYCELEFLMIPSP